MAGRGGARCRVARSLWKLGGGEMLVDFSFWSECVFEIYINVLLNCHIIFTGACCEVVTVNLRE